MTRLNGKSSRRLPCWARVRPAGLRWWMAGTPGHCSAWYYRTPWMALRAARRLHSAGARVTAPQPVLSEAGDPEGGGQCPNC